MAQFKCPVEAGEVRGIDMASYLLGCHLCGQELPDPLAPLSQLAAKPKFGQPHFQPRPDSGSALGAMSVKVEAVGGRSESGSGCNLAQALVHQVFYLTVELNVFNAATAQAYEVVVVTE